MNKYVYSRFVFRWYHGHVPSLFNDLFTSVDEVHMYNTRQSKFLYCREINTHLGKSNLSYRGPHIWNKIIKSKINLDISEPVFVKSLKQCIKVGII